MDDIQGMYGACGKAALCGMNAEKARQSIEAFAAGQRKFEVADTLLRVFPTYSGTVLFSCAGNRMFVTKGTRCQKGLVAEHVVARLGQLMEAGVGEIALVNIPDALRAFPAVAAMGVGPAHATMYVDNVSDRETLAYVNVLQNRSRFARLCVLYSMTHASDHQLFYSTVPPNLVYSFDHGHFFPSGPNWSVATIQSATIGSVDPWFAGVNLTNIELAEARIRLESITDTDIQNVLAGPPPEWPFTPDEKNALDTFLKRRRDRLLAILPQS